MDGMKVKDAVFLPAPADFTYPEDFYSTTNYDTEVLVGGRWTGIAGQRMDAVIVKLPTGEFLCKKFRDIKKGDLIACRGEGIRTLERKEDGKTGGFGFMGSDVSSEKNTAMMIRKIAEEMKGIKARGGKIVFVPGPVVVHTGGAGALASIIRKGYCAALLSGNALAVHDIESSRMGTSLGVKLETGKFVPEGNRNHIAAINFVFSCGGIAKAVNAGKLKSGVMYECVKGGVPFCLAPSIRDDGPLPDVITDIVQAQKEYFRLLSGADMVIMLATMLHAIGVGNMLPARVKTICVDITPATATKLSDRGTAQAVGVVTDVGLFLHELDANL